MKSEQIVIVLIVAVAVLASILVGASIQGKIGLDTIPTTTQQGLISGKVSIGPLCPIEPCPTPRQDLYSSRELILQPEVGNSIRIKLNADGGFQARVNAGKYTVNLTDCVFLG